MKLYIFSNRRTLNIYHLFVFGVRVVCASCWVRVVLVGAVNVSGIIPVNASLPVNARLKILLEVKDK